MGIGRLGSGDQAAVICDVVSECFHISEGGFATGMVETVIFIQRCQERIGVVGQKFRIIGGKEDCINSHIIKMNDRFFRAACHEHGNFCPVHGIF